MTNDNVLGDLHDYHLEILKTNVDWGRLVLDAIEEIERLRKALDEGLRLGALGAIVTEKWKCNE